ncbi:taperin [Megalops cyprinoides]|uniref:taperin n=1 Tax=Megalops cyprinoides TaxID=118141 RepID=UPI001863F81D|nr:taperin [Megalops cyprinoides]
MSSGEVRVLRREAGQESPRMPAWKREILERRKAKGGVAGAGGSEPCSSAGTARVNGEVTGDSSGSKNKEAVSSTSSARSYTITPASQHFAGKHGSATASPELSPMKSNKDPWATNDTHDSEKTGRQRGEEESLVLQDSLGPLQENPFIKLEKERKKRQDRDGATRPVQHILELYGSVPGIRTIRAENIIIIESDPDYFPDASGIKAGGKLQQNGTVSSYSSLNDLLDRRGSAVTEIRAKEVVIYDSALSKSEENLSTLGRPGSDGVLDPESQGRVSRMLQKFDRNYGKLQPKSRSTENLLELDSSPARPRLRPKPQPDQVPKSRTPPLSRSPAQSPDRSSPAPVFHSSPSSKPQAETPLERESSAPSAESPQSVSSFRRRFETGGTGRPGGGRTILVNPREAAERFQAKPLRERDWEGADGPSKPRVPCSPERHPRPCAESPSPPPSPPSPGFEIRPSPRPDLSALPAGDIQARALANLRLQSRNSFTVIPKRPAAVSGPGSVAPPSPARPPSPRASDTAAPAVPSPTTRPPTPPSSKKRDREAAARQAKTEPPKPAAPLVPSSPVASPEPAEDAPAPVAPPEAPRAADHLPVTNIDDIEVATPPQPAPSPVVQRRTGNTFTVVPKRKPGSPEPQDTAASPQTPSTPSTPPQAPYAQLGSLLKKRYPAVDEIEVIGGYLSLGRSCLSKTGSTGKKLKISFNESSLQSTFEYPSESSLWDSGEEEEEREEEEQEQPGEAEAEGIHIPRPSYTSSPTNSTNSSDLSSYTPKNSVDFSAWQEHKLDDPALQGDSNSRRTELSPEEVMLTPADSSSLSDFGSEPALYF